MHEPNNNTNSEQHPFDCRERLLISLPKRAKKKTIPDFFQVMAHAEGEKKNQKRRRLDKLGVVTDDSSHVSMSSMASNHHEGKKCAGLTPSALQRSLLTMGKNSEDAILLCDSDDEDHVDGRTNSSSNRTNPNGEHTIRADPTKKKSASLSEHSEERTVVDLLDSDDDRDCNASCGGQATYVVTKPKSSEKKADTSVIPDNHLSDDSASGNIQRCEKLVAQVVGGFSARPPEPISELQLSHEDLHENAHTTSSLEESEQSSKQNSLDSNTRQNNSLALSGISLLLDPSLGIHYDPGISTVSCRRAGKTGTEDQLLTNMEIIEIEDSSDDDDDSSVVRNSTLKKAKSSLQHKPTHRTSPNDHHRKMRQQPFIARCSALPPLHAALKRSSNSLDLKTKPTLGLNTTSKSRLEGAELGYVNGTANATNGTPYNGWNYRGLSPGCSSGKDRRVLDKDEQEMEDRKMPAKPRLKLPPTDARDVAAKCTTSEWRLTFSFSSDDDSSVGDGVDFDEDDQNGEDQKMPVKPPLNRQSSIDMNVKEPLIPIELRTESKEKKSTWQSQLTNCEGNDGPEDSSFQCSDVSISDENSDDDDDEDYDANASEEWNAKLSNIWVRRRLHSDSANKCATGLPAKKRSAPSEPAQTAVPVQELMDRAKDTSLFQRKANDEPYSLKEFKEIWKLMEDRHSVSTEQLENKRNGMVRKSNNAANGLQYGRILPQAMEFIFNAAMGGLGRENVFLDIGHGIGNVVIQGAFTRGCRSRGIEYVEERNTLASIYKWGFNDISEFHVTEGIRNFKPGDIELRQGDLRLPKNRSFLVDDVDFAFCNNFGGVFSGERGGNPTKEAVLDGHVAGLFASMKEGTVLVTLSPLRSFLGCSRLSSANEFRNNHGIPGSEKASFYEVEEIDMDIEDEAVSWSKKGGLKVYKYTRTCQSTADGKAVFLCNNFQGQCHHALKSVPMLAVSFASEGRLTVGTCTSCSMSNMILRSR